MLNQLFVESAKEYKGNGTNEDYKEQFDNGNGDAVIAHIFANNYKLFKSTASQYIGIDPAELENIILTQIWKCLDNYDSSKSKGKITTMICTYIRNECRRYTEANNTNKCKINQAHISTLFSEYDDPDRLEQMGIDTEYNLMETKEYLNQLDLSENQRKFCEIILDAPSDIKLTDVAREMGISRAGVSGIQKQLQNKLQDLID